MAQIVILHKDTISSGHNFYIHNIALQPQKYLSVKCIFSGSFMRYFPCIFIPTQCAAAVARVTDYDSGYLGLNLHSDMEIHGTECVELLNSLFK